MQHPFPGRIHRATAPARALAVVFVLALVVAACGGGGRDDDAGGTTTPRATSGEEEPILDTSACTTSPTTGISGNTIKLGTSLPQSGLYSAFTEILNGERAYFEYLNEELGGVEIAGEKYLIELVSKDDAYEAERTVTNVTQLINDDQVFALFNVVGTKNNLAIRDTVQQQCIPSLFAATGSPAWGNHDYPWILGTELVPYPLEAKALVDHLLETMPDATIAILRANDDFGRAYVDTLESLIEGTDLSIVKEETYNVEQFDTKSQVTSLAATRADVFFLGATLLGCPASLGNVASSGWDPLVYMSGTCTSKTLMDRAVSLGGGDGVLSVIPLLDPVDPANASNAEVQLYREKIGQYAPAESDADNAIVAYGWSTAALLADLLSKSPAADRVSVMETARAYEASGVALMPDGVTFRTTADDWFLGETFQLVRYTADGGYFEPVGDLVDEDGNTAQHTPDDLING